ncbi:MAG: decaprenyl-phosphate phosphoribosyltransferase [Ilumatobacteraceae bacterium]|jgi:decaprenyl-phosphate phosphoribosyltransferase|nr:decaprenyl-phosphate phosphoribosyltransferase [Ilumatobacteraceae bacterium]
MMSALLREARPKQWLKNVLVFAAPGAAGVLDDPEQLGLTLLAFVAFCLASSGTYYWNDLLDVEADRAHPTKRHRPIASGAIPLGTARLVGTGLLVASLATSALIGRWQMVVVVAVYVALTLSYSVWFKHVAVVDLVVIASGFVLRAAGGAVAVDVPMSSWFVLCITFGSLFIVTGKRYAELRELGDDAGGVRATLDTYSLQYLRMVLTLAVGATILSYCVWAFETSAGSTEDFPWYELSVVPVLTALLRYLLVLDQGHGAAPEEVFMADRWLQALGVSWVVVYAIAVYSA